VYLIDTNVISEMRKGRRADRGVRRFFEMAIRDGSDVFLSVVTIGELRRGIDLIRHRGDGLQTRRLEHRFGTLLEDYADYILEFDLEIAQVWGKLRVPHPENALDKKIAATALVHDLTVVTRTKRHFDSKTVRILDPFEGRKHHEQSG